MQIRRFESPSAFLARAEHWLLGAEAENNVAIGLARRYVERPAGRASDQYWATAEHADEVVGCAFRTPPHRLGLTRFALDAIPALVDDVAAAHERIRGVGGPVGEAERFAAEWAKRFGCGFEVHTRLRIHVLTRVVTDAPPPPGRLRPATARETPLIREWSRCFVRDTGVIEDSDALAERLVASRRLYLWDAGGPRCMVASARDTPNGACITAVFTPRTERRRGYATAAVAALSRLLLDRGYRFCCLYTDLGNPTSNAIYRRIGYAPVQDAVDIDFIDQPAAPLAR